MIPADDELPPLPDDYASRLPRFAEAPERVSVGLDAHDRPAELAPGAALAWRALHAAARADGRSLQLLSAFRSIARQREIVTAKLRRGVSWTQILRVNAAPGFSEHHTGRAIDLGAPGCPPLTTAFAETLEFAWLSTRAAEFGFTLSFPADNPFGLTYEPWHWAWQPSPAVP